MVRLVYYYTAKFELSSHLLVKMRTNLIKSKTGFYSVSLIKDRGENSAIYGFFQLFSEIKVNACVYLIFSLHLSRLEDENGDCLFYSFLLMICMVCFLFIFKMIIVEKKAVTILFIMPHLILDMPFPTRMKIQWFQKQLNSVFIFLRVSILIEIFKTLLIYIDLSWWPAIFIQRSGTHRHVINVWL